MVGRYRRPSHYGRRHVPEELDQDMRPADLIDALVRLRFAGNHAAATRPHPASILENRTTVAGIVAIRAPRRSVRS
jgi:hypothetical protein